MFYGLMDHRKIDKFQFCSTLDSYTVCVLGEFRRFVEIFDFQQN